MEQDPLEVTGAWNQGWLHRRPRLEHFSTGGEGGAGTVPPRRVLIFCLC